MMISANNKTGYSQQKIGGTSLFIRFLLLALACVLLLIFSALSGRLASDSTALTYGLVLIVIVLGVPHGALDFTKARRTLGAFALLVYGCAYVAITVVAFYLLRAFPAIMLPLLLLIASWHFGETYRQVFNYQTTEEPCLYWLRAVAIVSAFAVGALPVTLSILFYPEATMRLFASIAGSNAAVISMRIWELGQWFFILFVMLALVFAIWRTMRVGKQEFAVGAIDGAEIIATLFIFTFAPPLLAFTLYFCFIHAPRHTAVALQSLTESLTRKSQTKGLLLEALLMSLAAVALIWGLWLLLPLQPTGTAASLDAATILFSGLLSITVAHAAHDNLCVLLK